MHMFLMYHVTGALKSRNFVMMMMMMMMIYIKH